MVKHVSISETINELKLQILYMPENGLEKAITLPHVNRAGMLLMGFEKLHNEDIIQVMGQREYVYYEELTEEKKKSTLDAYFSHKFPFLVLAHDIPCVPYLLEAAKRVQTPVLRSLQHPADFTFNFITSMQKKLATRHTINATFIEVHGEGILLTGESSIGKTETALELVERGHRLVSDDTVEIYMRADGFLMGEAPKLTQHFAEIRGIGIVNIRTLFGEVAVLNNKTIDMKIDLVKWDNDAKYDRLGLDEQTETLFGCEIPFITLPVSQGRSIAPEIEIAAINNRFKKKGKNFAAILDAKIRDRMQGNS